MDIAVQLPTTGAAPTRAAPGGDRIPLDFEALRQEAIDLIERHPVMVLATCADGRVTARSMSVVHCELEVYFQTASTSLKYRQLAASPAVALCAGNLQIEGLARDLGHPLDPSNQFFAAAYAGRHPGSFQTYSGLATNTVIAVTPLRFGLWKYGADGRPFQDFWELETRAAWREIYPLEG